VLSAVLVKKTHGGRELKESSGDVAIWDILGDRSSSWGSVTQASDGDLLWGITKKGMKRGIGVHFVEANHFCRARIAKGMEGKEGGEGSRRLKVIGGA